MSSGVANNEEDKKPTEQGGAHINLKVKGQVRSILPSFPTLLIVFFGLILISFSCVYDL
jgi:hypothetical protein